VIKLKLSPSKVEKYRLYNEEEYNGTITRENVIETITGESKYSAKAEFGTAFHAVMQYGKKRFFDPKTGLYLVKADDMPDIVVLKEQEAKYADAYHHAHPNMTWETWHTFLYVLDDRYEIEFRMRFDGIEGDCLHEHKTSSRPMNYGFFESSMQWRCYLIGSEAQRITYHVFSYKEPTESRDYREITPSDFSFFPNREMHHELNSNLRGLITFCEFNGVMDYILRKDKPAEDCGFFVD